MFEVSGCSGTLERCLSKGLFRLRPLFCLQASRKVLDLSWNVSLVITVHCWNGVYLHTSSWWIRSAWHCSAPALVVPGILTSFASTQMITLSQVGCMMNQLYIVLILYWCWGCLCLAQVLLAIYLKGDGLEWYAFDILLANSGSESTGELEFIWKYNLYIVFVL